MKSIPYSIALKQVALGGRDVLHNRGAFISRAGCWLMLSLIFATSSVHSAAESPTEPPQGSAVASVEVAPAAASAAVGKANGMDPTRETHKPVDGQKDAATPTEQQCKAPYPSGVQVMSAGRIAYRDIRAAQTADVSVEKIGADGRPGQRADAKLATTPTAQKPGQRSSAVQKGLVEPGVAELRHALMVEVAQLPALAMLAKCPSNRKLVLFLAGRPMPGLTAYPSTDPTHNTIIFLLERTKTNKDDWTFLLGRASFRPVPINVSIGFDDSYALPSNVTVSFRAIPVGWSIVWFCIMMMFALLILWAGKNSGMLRDRGEVAAGQRAMFSLARIQLTYWTFIVLGSFILIGMITGDYLNSVNEKVLALMGISIGTSLGSSVIDNGASGTSMRAALPSTGTWWRDILNDGKDISIHRFQMIAWTIVLGIVFLHGVYSTLAMPDLPAELLGLMGISAGAYLGLKVTVETPSNAVLAGGAPVAGAGSAGSRPVGPAAHSPPEANTSNLPLGPAIALPPAGAG